jgi:uncharacterized repeat protein (TIGR03806 family)
MRKLQFSVIALLLLVVLSFASCSKETLEETLPNGALGTNKVDFDLEQVPYSTLSAYGFFQGKMALMKPAEGVLPFEPISALFTDEAKKARFVWMPPGVRASYNGDHDVLNFPDGAMLLKNFYYDNAQPGGQRRLIETRMLFKRAGQWEIYNYVWNSAQTEAFLDQVGSTVPVSWIDEEGITRNIQYRIPSLVECQSCHRKSGLNTPIGPEPQNLNSDKWYASGRENQLKQWVRQGYLEPGYPKNITTVVDWKDPSQDIDLRARSYLDINCAHCHDEGRSCSYRAIRLGFDRTDDPVNLGVCVVPEEPVSPFSHIVARGNVGRSVLHFRLTTDDEALRMPLIGRSIVDEEGVAMIEEWITSQGPPCP